MINKNFFNYKTYQTFLQDKQAGNIPNTAVCFIEDKKIIYTHGTEYYSPNGTSEDILYGDETNEEVVPLPDIVTVDRAVADGLGNNITNTYATKSELTNVTPTIGSNGNWFINGKDTGKSSKGADGISLGEIALVLELSTEEGSESRVISLKIISEKINNLENKAVVTYTEQELTPEELAQVQKNIGLEKTINGESLSGSGNIVINPTIMDLKWTTNTATTRKLVPIELRKKGVKIAYTNASKVYIVEQYQIDDIDDTNWSSDASWKGCRTPLTILFEKGGAKFNEETGFYEMNELDDLTENDMLKIYILSYGKNSGSSANFSAFSGSNETHIRTNFPFVTVFKTFSQVSLYGQSSIEIFTCESIQKGNEQPLVTSSFEVYSTKKLRKILGIVNIENMTSNGYYKFPAVFEHGLFKRLKISFNMLKDTPVIDYESIKYLIDNAINKEAITITVHPTTYDYLTGTTEPTELVGGTTEEWQAIVTAATEKNISFATE